MSAIKEPQNTMLHNKRHTSALSAELAPFRPEPVRTHAVLNRRHINNGFPHPDLPDHHAGYQHDRYKAFLKGCQADKAAGFAPDRHRRQMLAGLLALLLAAALSLIALVGTAQTANNGGTEANKPGESLQQDPDAQAKSDRELASFNAKITNVMMRLMYVPTGPCYAYYALNNFKIDESTYKLDKVSITGNMDKEKARDLRKMLDTLTINWKDLLGDRQIAGRSILFPLLLRPEKCKEVTIASDQLQSLIRELTRPGDSKTMINDKYIYLPMRESKYRTE